MSTTTLRATAATYLKSRPRDSSQLQDSEKIAIEEGTVLNLGDAGSLKRKHYKVEVLPENDLDAFVSKFGRVGYVYSGHWAIVYTDDPDLISEQPPTAQHQAVQRQIDRLSAYLPRGKTLSLEAKTEYCSQRDNYTMAHRTCNSSANYMYLAWLRKVAGMQPLSGDDEYLRKVLEYGDTIYHSHQTQAVDDYGFKTKWMMDADLNFIKSLVTTGFPVVCNILHRGSIAAPRGGHIIMLIGRKGGYWISHDPYGTLTSDYRNPNGAYSKIREDIFSRRWQGGYRILK